MWHSFTEKRALFSIKAFFYCSVLSLYVLLPVATQSLDILIRDHYYFDSVHKYSIEILFISTPPKENDNLSNLLHLLKFHTDALISSTVPTADQAALELVGLSCLAQGHEGSLVAHQPCRITVPPVCQRQMCTCHYNT